MSHFKDWSDPEPDDEDWDEDGKHTTCNRCGADIFLAQDPEDGKWKPYVSATSDDKHTCQTKASNFFKKL